MRMHPAIKNSIGLLSVFVLVLMSSCSDQPPPANAISEHAADSPVGVLKSFTEAKRTKNAAAMKQALSKGTLDTIAAVGSSRGQGLDEFLLLGNTTPLNRPNVPEFRNLRIDSDIAVMEISRNSGDSWRKLTFVKEDGLWKMDLNLYMKELYPKLGTDTSGPPPPAPSR